MSALDTTPTNKNFLSPLGFRFFIKKLPNVNFFVQKVNVPGINIAQNPAMPNPFTKIPYAGDHLEFSELELTYRVDEDLTNYLEVYNWIRGLAFPESYAEYSALANKPLASGEGLKSDASLIITTNGKSPNFECVFEDVFPVSLSNIDFLTTDETVNYIEATATFLYTQFKISAL